MSKLQSLEIIFGTINDGIPITLVNSIRDVFPQLENFHLILNNEEEHFLPDSFTTVFPSLGQSGSLQHLKIKNFNLSDELVKIVSALNLSTLDLDLGKETNFVDLEFMEKLTTLSLSNGINDNFLQNIIAKAENLSELKIGASKISNNGVCDIGQLQHLTDLILAIPDGFENISLTDESISEFCKLEKLRYLSICNFKNITNECVKDIIQELKNLELLVTGNTNVNSELADVLQGAELERRAKKLLTGLNFNNNDDEDRLPDTLPGDETQSQPLSSSPLNKISKGTWGILIPCCQRQLDEHHNNNRKPLKICCLIKNEYTAGRLEHVDIQFNEENTDLKRLLQTSKTQFIIKRDFVVFIYDKSMNGTYINKKKLKNNKGILLHNDTISIASPNYKVFEYLQSTKLVDMPPELAKNYVALRVLGYGIYGPVTLIYSKTDYCPLALKCSRTNSIDERAYQDNFMNEVDILKGLKHPNVIKIVHEINTESEICIMLEGNKDLLDVIREGTYDFTPDIFKNISVEAKNLIDKMLTVNPNDRYTAPRVLASSWLDDTELMEKISQTLKPHINIDNNDNDKIKSQNFDRGIGSK
ncbi:hypothetical protein HCN44_001440 [Aphidius gifuensis]|uniref:Uncharacterized protein n=1 Tax=Aphidius gifuensis TaxID=684658 RepID=A0A834XRF7_APHGI|nr:hypothetical protein HCN44_001440 [Aphidius gifuensis]